VRLHAPGDSSGRLLSLFALEQTWRPAGGGLAGDADKLWTYEELSAIKREINAAGLELEAIENFDAAHWHDVLLDGPKKHEQLENLKTIIRNLGRAGIPIFGYNFSIAGVAGRIKGPFARQAEAVGVDGAFDKPMPRGMVWNMIYDSKAPAGIVAPATQEELWQRLSDLPSFPSLKKPASPRRTPRRSAAADHPLPAATRQQALASGIYEISFCNAFGKRELKSSGRHVNGCAKSSLPAWRASREQASDLAP
jgi:D-mannonate dehydratase (UxuA)